MRKNGLAGDEAGAVSRPEGRVEPGPEPDTPPDAEDRVTGPIDRTLEGAATGAAPQAGPEDGRDRPGGAGAEESLLDSREALFNHGATGAASRIQLPTERITRLRGAMVDLDPGKLIPDNRLFPPAGDPSGFLARIRAVLDRHPLARDAEVRASGTGLHLILWFEPAVELRSAGDQRWWDGLIRVIQATLPSDPNAPGITALTRPVGSVNSRNGARVATLRQGTPIAPQRVVDFAERVKAAPFRAVAEILLGGGRITPCPVCAGARSSLTALDHAGECYGCGRVTLAALYDTILAPEAAENAEDDAEDRRPDPRRKPHAKAARRTARRT